MNERKRKNIIIMALCACITLMGIGYALLSQTLTINTTATINSTWDIRITNVEVANRVGYATDTSDEDNIADDGHSATVSANLLAPGDTITYTVTVHNFGTIAGMYDVATQNLITPGAGQPSGIVTATTDVATSNSLKYLAPQTGEGTFNVTLKFEDIDELPEVKEYSFTIAPNFVQTSESGVTPGGDTNEGEYTYKIYSQDGGNFNVYCILITDYNNNYYLSLYADDKSGNDVSEEEISWNTGDVMPVNITNYSGVERIIPIYANGDDYLSELNPIYQFMFNNNSFIIEGIDMSFDDNYLLFDSAGLVKDYIGSDRLYVRDFDFDASQIDFNFNN